MKHQGPEIHLGEQAKDGVLGLMKSDDQGRTRDVKETCVNVANGNGIYEANVISGKMGQLQRDMTNLNQRSMEVDDVRSDLNDVSKDSTPKDVPVTVISGHEQSKIFQAKLQLPSSSQDLNSDDVPILELRLLQPTCEWEELESESRSLVCSLEWKSNIAH
ncbi:uncharacterized protein DS421_3g64910 [Arachis hypogaea]|nr:uncharacterized protein DS421_3g64910 [Arachis hypogaea]